jgi:hypothetical protein
MGAASVVSGQRGIGAAPMFWVPVKFDMDEKRIVEEYNSWYSNIHVRDLVAGEGFFHGWRTGEASELDRSGPDGQEFWAIYAIDALERFAFIHRAPTEGTGQVRTPIPPVTTDDPKRLLDLIFRKLMTNWGRPMYEVLSAAETDDAPGTLFYREEFTFGDGGDSPEFERHVRDTYLPAVLERPGVHRAWQLAITESDLHVGPLPEGRYMNVFEIDAADDLDGDRPDLARWTSDDGSQVTSTGAHFAHLLSTLSHDEAVAAS